MGASQLLPHPGTAQTGHHCLWTKLKLMAGQSLGLQGSVWQPWDNRRKARKASLVTPSHQPHFAPRCSHGYGRFLGSPRLCSNIRWQACVAPQSSAWSSPGTDWLGEPSVCFSAYISGRSVIGRNAAPATFPTEGP